MLVTFITSTFSCPCNLSIKVQKVHSLSITQGHGFSFNNLLFFSCTQQRIWTRVCERLFYVDISCVPLTASWGPLVIGRYLSEVTIHSVLIMIAALRSLSWFTVMKTNGICSSNEDDMSGSYLHFINLLIIHLCNFCGNLIGTNQSEYVWQFVLDFLRGKEIYCL